jgi:hypothetical protein
VRTIDDGGKPVPFVEVTFASRVRGMPDKVDEYATINADEEGRALYDKIDGFFSISVQRMEVIPETHSTRFEFKRIAELRHTSDREEILVKWDPFPSGTGKVSGRVRNQHGKPLREFFLFISSERGDRLGADDFHSFGYRIPFIDPEGRYELAGLPPGDYLVRARAFDYPTHNWYGPENRFVIPEKGDTPIVANIEVEANELLYGRALYEDGSPVSRVGWIAIFEPKRPGVQPYGVSFNGNADGTFRVHLSAQNRRDLIEHSGGFVKITDHAGDIGAVHIDDLGKEGMTPITTFTFKRPPSPDE